MILDLKMLVGIASNQLPSSPIGTLNQTEAAEILTISDEDRPHIISYSFSPDEELLAGCSEISVSGTLKVVSSMVYLDLRADYFLTVSCDRCTEIFTRKYSLPIEHILVTSHNTDNYDDTIIVIEDSRVDLDELITSDIQLSLPMKQLCREDCRGICQKCGKNLNEGDCGCNDSEIDPRLAALKSLLED
ncbi:MAG: DUF177 domain-containing protein [Clostridia bacterium]|nr:DUF177 domain-containing protein [Clostridia bacterium]